MTTKLSLISILEEFVIAGGISKEEALDISKEMKIDFSKEKFSFEDFVAGANHEIEHQKVLNKNPKSIAQIAVDHLKEDPEYYQKLKTIEEKYSGPKKYKKQLRTEKLFDME
jgi:hypothetical protein